MTKKIIYFRVNEGYGCLCGRQFIADCYFCPCKKCTTYSDSLVRVDADSDKAINAIKKSERVGRIRIIAVFAYNDIDKEYKHNGNQI